MATVERTMHEGTVDTACRLAGGSARLDPLAGRELELRKALKGLRRLLNAMELDEAVGRGGRGDPELLAFARRMIGERARRLQYFDGHLFSDPAWDIMLDLFVAEIEMREVPVTNLCFTSNVPDTTVLRWIKTLCAEGLLVRHKDRVDKRRVLVQLARPASDAMRRYVEEQLAAAERMHVALRRDIAEGGPLAA